jgi:methylisocitrate lyase
MPPAVSLSPGRRLRDAWARPPLALPGVFSPLIARMAERLGYRALYLSGAALSASLGLPDVGLTTLTEFADEVRRMTAASSLPLLCDADTGFGEALNVERTVKCFEAAGAAGLHLEDQAMPKRCGHLSGKQLIEAEAMAAKVRAACAARRDPDFVIVARTDARGVTGFDDAVRRARLYLAAGADAIFPEALESADEFAAFAREVKAPLLANMTEFGRGPLLDLADLAAMGYRMVIYPVTALRAALKAVQQTLADILARGCQRDRLPQMLTRGELYELLDYAGYDARDRAYFGPEATTDAAVEKARAERPA